MRLGELLALEKVEAIAGDLEREVEGLAYDSRRVEPGSVFFAIRGEKSDGHDFLQQAADRGATALVVERVMPSPPGRYDSRARCAPRHGTLVGAFFWGPEPPS